MKKKVIVAEILVFTAIVILFWNMIVTVKTHGRAADLVEEYQAYYFKEVWRHGFSPWGTNNWFRYIYFLPGQRTGMRNKIGEDITNKLETLVEEHGEIIYKYEISNNFKGVRIYIASGDIDRNKLYDIQYEMKERLGALIELYQCVKEGHPVSINQVHDENGVLTGEGVIFIEPDGFKW